MLIRRLVIENFRGIESCDWWIDTRFVALVGPGDSTKTTLLDAMGFVLSPSYNLQITDADFFQCDTAKDIVIEATITELPDQLVQESQLGKYRSGLREDHTVEHDPVEGAEECLVLRFRVAADLEPTWEVIRPGEEAGKAVTAAQRQRLGFSRVGERVDLHLRWSRTSALTSLSGADATSALLLSAHRTARETVFDQASTVLVDAAAKATERAIALGSGPFKLLRPGLEPINGSSAHSLLLHDEQIPLTSFGLGTRRLTSLAIQSSSIEGGSIVAIDEVESGLEPHRLSNLLIKLREDTSSHDLQVFLTTHSPIAVQCLTSHDLSVVRTSSGFTTVCSVPEAIDNIQGTLRSAPSALLARRIIVGEGATEVGFVRGILAQVDEDRRGLGELTSATIGVALVNGGGGAQSLGRSRDLARLAYTTLSLVDNDDRSIDSAVGLAASNNVQVERWEPGMALEDAVVQTLAWPDLASLIKLASDNLGEESICQRVANLLDVTSLTGLDPTAWIDQANAAEQEVRSAIAAASQGKKADQSKPKAEGDAWFKREDLAFELAELVWSCKARWIQPHRMDALQHVIEFVYGADPSRTEESEGV